MSAAVTIDDVRAAAARIAGAAHVTPILTCSTIDAMAGRRLHFKCEQFQKVGAFKFRGAWNAVQLVPDAAAPRGVITHSSGNHAQALALAARMRGIPAHIVMPSTASAVKRRAVEGYGARVIACEPNLAAREAAASAALSETGGTLIPPYDHLDVIAGQGTIALEMLAAIPRLDALVIPVGGGGLLAGNCVAAKALHPAIRIFAAEPAGADDAARSMAAGERIPVTAPRTVADGLMTSLGVMTWPIIRQNVERVITVTDEEIIAALRLAWERAKLLVEPSAAVALAAVLTDAFRGLPGIENVGVVLSGGNIDLDALPWR